MLFVDSTFNALQVHRNQQSSECHKLYKHHKKCYDAPNKYMGLIIDGMDKKKTLFPHFSRIPTSLKEENLIKFHLAGCLVFDGRMSPNIHNDANMTITIIHYVLTHCLDNLP